jgi:hypothetical protein
MNLQNFDASIISNANRLVEGKVPDLTFVNGAIPDLTRVRLQISEETLQSFYYKANLFV